MADETLQSSELVKITPKTQAAWMDYEPFCAITDNIRAVRISSMIRHAFFSGFIAGEKRP